MNKVVAIETARPRWTCEVCANPLRGDDGLVAVSYDEIDGRRAETESWRSAHRIGSDDDPVTIGTDFDDYPAQVRWHVIHDRCGGESRVSRPYGIDSGRLRTWRNVTAWTAHLTEKRWFAETDWPQLLRTAGCGFP